MKCIIQRQSITDMSVCPHENAYWDSNLKSWCIDIMSMDHLVSIMKRFPDCINNSPEALISIINKTNKMLLITIYDGYLEWEI